MTNNFDDEIDLLDIEETHTLLSQEERWLTDAEFGGFRNMVRMSQEHETKSDLNTRKNDRTIEIDDNAFGVKIHGCIWVYRSNEQEPFPEDVRRKEAEKKKPKDKRKQVRIRYSLFIYDDKGNRYQLKAGVPVCIERGRTDAEKNNLKNELKSKKDNKLLELVRYWVLTPNIPECNLQAPSPPYNRIPIWLLWEVYEAEWALRERVKNMSDEERKKLPFEERFAWYQYCGCSGHDKAFRKAIFLKLDPKKHRDKWPAGLVKRGGRYYIPRALETEEGVSSRAHWLAHLQTITAKQVKDLMDKTKEKTWEDSDPQNWFNPDPAQLLTSLAINTDETLLKKAFSSPVLTWEQEEEMQEKLLERAREISERDGIDFNVAKETIQHSIRSNFEGFVDKNYDPWTPDEQYNFRNIMFDLWMAGRTSDPKKAVDCLWSLTCLFYYLDEKYPPILTPDGVDFSKIRVLLAPDSETRRTRARMKANWQQIKSLKSTIATGEAKLSDVDTARRLDLGGYKNPGPIPWRLKLLLGIVEREPSRREEILGKALADLSDEEIWNEFPHDGVLVFWFVKIKVSWAAGILQIASQAVKSGRAEFPRRVNRGLDADIAEMANYPDPDMMAERSVFTKAYPLSAWGNHEGPLTPFLMHESNLRLSRFFPDRYDGAGKLVYKSPVRLNYDNCCAQQDFVELMAENLPIAPIVKRMTQIWNDEVRKGTPHIRPVIAQWLEGLEQSVWEKLTTFRQYIYKLSDQRVRRFVASETHGRDGNLRGLRAAEGKKYDDEGYGIDNGLELPEQQDRQLDLRFFGYLTEQMDKAVWMVRGIVANIEANVSFTEQYKEVTKAQMSGFHPRVVDIVVKALTKYRAIDWSWLLPKGTPEEVKYIEDTYNDMEQEFLGIEPVEAVAAGLLHQESILSLTTDEKGGFQLVDSLAP